MKNDTRIKYLFVLDKLYEVIRIDLIEQTIEARETSLLVTEVIDSEVFNIVDFAEFRVTLINRFGTKIIDFDAYKKSVLLQEDK